MFAVYFCVIDQPKWPIARGKKTKQLNLGGSPSYERHNLVSLLFPQLVMGYFLGLFQNVTGFL
jgi:hypothetical protein